MGKGDEKMLERGKMDRDMVEFVVIDQLVPKEHLLRKVDAAVDFTRLYEMVEPLYSEDNGRPSIDPVVLFKMVLIQHLYGLPSLRRTAEEVSLNVHLGMVEFGDTQKLLIGNFPSSPLNSVEKHYILTKRVKFYRKSSAGGEK